MEYQELSVEEIRARLQEVDQKKVGLEKALLRRKQAARGDLVQQIRDLISRNGYAVEEILEVLTTKRRRGPVPGESTKKPGDGRGKGNRNYVTYVDPQNESNVYVRGVLPGWMKQKMAELGYDSSRKEDREKFKTSYLRPATPAAQG
ncbi:H-NS histone family protein [Rhodoferax sp. 4810]|uniref:H-NS histone family protein n=1 Tax=Thiospirillum jenense TaxID=1653858 RepID=A0A839H2P1_9GAMM|nr:H-NS histone family protein [Rhodoferax jenense]MBB1124745.1 H-NS histone family protein [Thiospirillum jenense]